MPKLAIIADDLTGANDTGVQFRKFGLRTLVVLEIKPGEWVRDADIVVVDTDSRAQLAAVSAQRVRDACRMFAGIGVRNLYKKIDSTLRGNIGAEIFAAWEEFKPEVTIIAPAFPKTGRNTVGGYQLLNGVPISLTEISRDPKTPVTEAYLPKLLADATGDRLGVVPLHIVAEGVASISTAMRDFMAAGRTWVVCDAACEEHLHDIAEAAKAFKKVLWVGSAGLAEQLVLAKGWISKDELMSEFIACNTVLVVSGSVSAVTQAQLQQYVEDVSAYSIVLDPVAAINDPQAESLRLSVAAIPMLKRANVVISCSNDRGIIGAAVTAGNKIGLSANGVGERIAEALGFAVVDLVKQGVDGLFLTGGETAISCCRALGAAGVEIFREVVPGIPLGRILGGPFHGLPIVTKAGAFGDSHAITKSVDTMKCRNGEK